jgi:tRNA(Ile)-lysidine synthase
MPLEKSTLKINMFDTFQKYVDTNQLFQPSNRILLAVSGGIDSSVMVDIFKKSGISFGIAHCNFSLRGDESNGDEAFVKAIAQQLDVPCFVITFNTAEYATANGVSIQMAARELRYSWFEETRKKNHFDYIATAHNKNDVVETFFINFARGTGIKGLSGIKPQNGKLIRPMLFASRNEIAHYAEVHQVRYREDSSNASIKYQRNLVRHKLIPILSQLNPSFIEVAAQNIQRLAEADELLDFTLLNIEKEIAHWQNDDYYIHIEKLMGYPAPSTLLFHLLSAFNFNADVCTQILENRNAEAGKQYYSHTHRLIKDRDYFIVNENSPVNKQCFYIEEDCRDLKTDIHLVIKVFENTAGFIFPKSKNIACLDYNKLNFPLIGREWQKGDYFRPLGMEQMKKLSDFFIDQKLSIRDKETVHLITSDGKIAWIAGYRIDDRFKITSETKRIFQIELIQNTNN